MSEQQTVTTRRGGWVHTYKVGERLRFLPAIGQIPRVGRITGFRKAGGTAPQLVYAEVVFQGRHYSKYIGIEAKAETP